MALLNQALALGLASLGYPGFAYLQPRNKTEKPMEILLAALSCSNPESRIIEALPWIPLRYWRMDFGRLIEEAKAHGIQNQLGFLVSIARRISQVGTNHIRTQTLKHVEAELDDIRIEGEFLLLPVTTSVQKDWVVLNREPEAKHWGVLATLKPEHMDYESWTENCAVEV